MKQNIQYKGPKTLEPLVRPVLEKITKNLGLEANHIFSAGYLQFPYMPKKFDHYQILIDNNSHLSYKYKSGSLSEEINPRELFDNYFDELFGYYLAENKRSRPNTNILEELSSNINNLVGPNSVELINENIGNYFERYDFILPEEGVTSGYSLSPLVANVPVGSGHFVMTEIRNLLPIYKELPTQINQVTVMPYSIILLLPNKEAQSFFIESLTHGIVHNEIIEGTTALRNDRELLKQRDKDFGELLCTIERSGMYFHGSYHKSLREYNAHRRMLCDLNIVALEEAIAGVIGSKLMHCLNSTPNQIEKTNRLREIISSRIKEKEISNSDLFPIVKKAISYSYIERRDAVEVLLENIG